MISSISLLNNSLSKYKCEKLCYEFKDIYNLEGGFITWSNQNLPFEFKSENKLDNLSQGFTKAYIDSILSLNTNTLIYVSTKWCAPCREMNPIVERLEEKAEAIEGLRIPEVLFWRICA